MDERKDPEGQEDKQAYSFLQETIKTGPGDKRTLKTDIFRMAILGIVFGVVASCSFSALKPWFESKFQDNPKKVTIPKDEEEDVTNPEEEQTEQVQQPLDEQSYRQMNQSLNVIAQEINKSVVELSGVMGDAWLGTSYDDRNSVAGLIVADNGQQLLILAKTNITKDANEITATFPDGRIYKAVLKRRDENLALGIYAVTRSEIQEATWSQMKIATLGTSTTMGKGEATIVVGKPFGYFGGVGYGIVASSKNVIDAADGQYRLICTDIAAAKEGSGFVANLNGEITGVVNQDISDNDSMNLVTAYGISDLKNNIELLSNGDAVPYIGIKGIDVTESIEQQGIPKGVYVKEVEVDSPAMAAGIQNGDIITEVGGTEIASFAKYNSVIMGKKTGQKLKVQGQRKGTGGYVDITFDITIGNKE